MEGLEVEWKKQAHRWWSQSLHYVHLIPPQQIYTAMAVLLFTTFLLLLGMYVYMYICSINLVLELVCNFNYFDLFIYFCDIVRLLKRPKANTILVTGLSGSRKTMLFYQISTFAAYSIFVIKLVTVSYDLMCSRQKIDSPIDLLFTIIRQSSLVSCLVHDM